MWRRHQKLSSCQTTHTQFQCNGEYQNESSHWDFCTFLKAMQPSKPTYSAPIMWSCTPRHQGKHAECIWNPAWTTFCLARLWVEISTSASVIGGKNGRTWLQSKGWACAHSTAKGVSAWLGFVSVQNVGSFWLAAMDTIAMSTTTAGRSTNAAKHTLASEGKGDVHGLAGRALGGVNAMLTIPKWISNRWTKGNAQASEQIFFHWWWI